MACIARGGPLQPAYSAATASLLTPLYRAQAPGVRTKGEISIGNRFEVIVTLPSEIPNYNLAYITQAHVVLGRSSEAGEGEAFSGSAVSILITSPLRVKEVTP